MTTFRQFLATLKRGDEVIVDYQECPTVDIKREGVDLHRKTDHWRWELPVPFMDMEYLNGLPCKWPVEDVLDGALALRGLKLTFVSQNLKDTIVFKYRVRWLPFWERRWWKKLFRRP